MVLSSYSSKRWHVLPHFVCRWPSAHQEAVAQQYICVYLWHKYNIALIIAYSVYLGMGLHEGPLPCHHDPLALLIYQLCTLLHVLHPLLQIAAVGGLCRASLALNGPQY